MSPSDAPRSPHPALIVASLCGSVLAIAILFFLESRLARAEIALTPEPPRKVERFVAAALPSPPVQRAEPARAEPSEPAPLAVPDFTGKRLSVARKEARALGLKLVARDPYGERVAPELASYYRVKKQLTQVGARLKPGDTVQVRVREVPGSAMGY